MSREAALQLPSGTVAVVLVRESRLLSGLCWPATHWGALIILAFNAWGKGEQDTGLGNHHVKILSWILNVAPPRSPGFG